MNIDSTRKEHLENRAKKSHLLLNFSKGGFFKIGLNFSLQVDVIDLVLGSALSVKQCSIESTLHLGNVDFS